MKNAIVFFAMLLLTASFSGCIIATEEKTGSDGSGSTSIDNAGGVTIPSEHGTPIIDESAVSTSQDDSGKWHATKTVTITNGFGGADECSLGLDTVNGGILVQAWNEGGYKTVANLEGMGDTEQQAKNNLESLTVTHSDELSGGRISLKTAVDVENSLGILPIDIFGNDWQNKCATISACVPQSAFYTVDASTTNGDVAATTSLRGEKFTARTTNGAAICSGGFNSLDISTTNGAIEVEIASAASGAYNLETTNGAISMRVKNNGDYGYDVSCKTTNGMLTIYLSNTETIEESDTSKHVRTEYYGSREIQIKATLNTTNGAIYVGEW
ncbi:MAG: hypothetical protein PHH26_02540 [Candidatus Thermoplasmatota archaeon]|nr:hypothetical protein [Candidatus Thermoplasmatota archaeon]